MKKVTLMAIAILFSVASAFAAHTNTSVADTTKTKKVKPAKLMYTCPMDADVLSDKPGKCPKCGMTLVKKDTSKKMPMKHKMSM
ncbi:heavy metal-binding domain-containing protein [Mucilaginibacter gotjawali]|uniref:Copper-transporting P-type ATPase n=2 Tax=Mucilaginibacter gotjawali TaxID=1550579 RepID=A0A120MXT8_9SPHI|nr:heavy metal-binding domain-containing protein [Mucilaginibacter gotjawali]MBB3058091.1 putative GH25 family protein [Mucilaginibacter gotjawali]BAU52066.1 Copper-transporting P-type ATPase [Mucilaginibacter gotjawali]